VAALDAMVARRRSGEPLQYVLGAWGFRRLDLLVDRRVLIPRPETEQVVERAIAELVREGTCQPSPASSSGRSLAVDLGTGSGAIGLSLAAEVDDLEVWLTDASPEALVVAQSNLAGLGVAGSRVRVAQGSWFGALPAELAGTVSLVVSNPPYIAEHEVLPSSVVDWEPPSALVAGPAGTEHLFHLVNESARWLHESGALVLEMAPWQTEPVAEMASPLFQEVDIGRDLEGKSRMVIARRAISRSAAEEEVMACSRTTTK